MQRSGMRVLLFTIALALIASAQLSAQTVGGTVVEIATGEPIQGAVVALVDSLGRRREAVLSDPQGQYSLQVPAPGTYRVRAERVGYAAASSPALALDSGEQVRQQLSMSPVHVTLDAVVARGVPRACTIRPENGEQAARVWDEARKALDATHLGGRAGAYEFRVRLFRRTLAFPRLAIVDSTSSVQSGYSRQPFATPVERLVTHGYMEVEGDSIVFRAPDAPTLLSDAFLDHHCFSLIRGRGTEAGMVGLAFAPVRDRRLPDVQGTLWLDGQTGHLRYLEYTYTRLPFASSDARLGGRVDFVQLPAGGWIVSRWRIRMPILVRENPRAQPIVKALVESGGEVLGVRTGRGARVPLRTVSVGQNSPAVASLAASPR
ncbi:carboxypeptidase-like regulatory domain-containing protein [Longimicrobium sp.]|uniref:carboxypeptidase-like regulatory domain-containing protein n=1 Tax=Longimicrobium sp. TaxID=2029185 RepID=UPI002EDB3A15